MPLFRSLGARKDATRGTTALEVRKGLEGLFTGPGVLPGAASPLVQGTADFAYQLNAAHFVTRRATGDGVHLFGNDGAMTVATGVAPGSGLSRIDVIWVRHPSAGENGDTASAPELGVTQGTAASIPVAPSIPTGALEVARNTMTSAATSTSSAGNTIAQTAPVIHRPGAEVALALPTANVDCAATDQIVTQVTFTAQPGMRYRIEFDGTVFRQSSLSTRATTRLRWAAGSTINTTSGTVAATRLTDCTVDNAVTGVRVSATIAPTAGPVTVAVHGSRTSGSGIISYSNSPANNTAVLRVVCVDAA